MSDLILSYIAVKIAGNANKLRKKQPKSRSRTKKYDWSDVLCNSKIRIRHYRDEY